MLHTTPWNAGSYGTLGPFASLAPQLLQQLQIVPQQLQQVQQAEYLQQQQLQQVLQMLQVVPQQIQQLLQVIQVLPQHVAGLVQQALTQASIGGFPTGITGLGAPAPFGGLSGPLQSAGFGTPFPVIQPAISAPFGGGQPGYVM
jgi:hypothetical protein